MQDLWITFIPLIVGSAVVPVQLIVTILLLRSTSGKLTAVAWVSGMTTVRLAQGLVFGLLLGAQDNAPADTGESGYLVPTVLLILAILFYVVAVKQLMHQPDDDAPPPKWLAMASSLTPGRAYLFGMGILLIGAKFWVFTLGAVAAIGDADLGRSESIAMFIVFVALAQSLQLLLLGAAFLVPARADTMLQRFSSVLEARNRQIVIVIGLVFGTWFLVKALAGLGIL